MLAQYRARVAWFARELRPPEVPAFVRHLAGGGRALGQALALPAASASASKLVTAADVGGGARPGQQQQQEREQQRREQQQQQQQELDGGGGGSGGASTSAAATFSASAAAKARMATQQRLQDDLTEDVLGLTAEMKAGARAMQSAIRFRGKLLDETETALVDSAENAKSVAAKARERYRAASRGFCFTCMLLLGVTAVFVATMAYIKLTATVGITGRRAPAPRPPRAPAYGGV